MAQRFALRGGRGDAMLQVLGGEEFNADTAMCFGLVREVVEPGEQLERAVEIAERIAAQASLAVAATQARARTMVRAGYEAAIAELGPLEATRCLARTGAEGM